jgi:hypothetical protein
MFVKSKGGVGFEREGGRRRGACRLLERDLKVVSIVRKGPQGRVDSPVSLSASIDTYSVAS